MARLFRNTIAVAGGLAIVLAGALPVGAQPVAAVAPAAATYVTIPDPGFRAAINTMLNSAGIGNKTNRAANAKIKKSEAAQLKSLYIDSRSTPYGVPVKRLDGVSALTGIESISITAGEITSLDPLKKLPAKTRKKVKRIVIIDAGLYPGITALGSFPNVEYLRIDGDALAKVKSFSALTKIKKLSILLLTFPFDYHLTKGKATPLAPLGKIASLRELYLQNPRIGDIKFVTTLKKLDSLTVYGTHVSDLTPVTKLAKLRNLVVSHSQVKNASPAAKLKKLLELDLRQNLITDLRPFKTKPSNSYHSLVLTGQHPTLTATAGKAVKNPLIDMNGKPIYVDGTGSTPQNPRTWLWTAPGTYTVNWSMQVTRPGVRSPGTYDGTLTVTVK